MSSVFPPQFSLQMLNGQIESLGSQSYMCGNVRLRGCQFGKSVFASTGNVFFNRKEKVIEIYL